jgi:GNAT superfamily N-acetyltransferase
VLFVKVGYYELGFIFFPPFSFFFLLFFYFLFLGFLFLWWIASSYRWCCIDVPTILSLMRATAAEQNVPSAVTATESGLLNTLDFTQSPTTTAATGLGPPDDTPTRLGQAIIIVAPEGEIAGMAIYFFTFVAWAAKPGICLEDLFVSPEFRRRGYAKRLLQEVAAIAKQAGCERVEWLCYKDNRTALDFYQSLGARELGNLTFLRLDRAATSALADT